MARLFRPGRARLRAAALALAAGLLCPAALAGSAAAASLGLDQRCYVAGEQAAVSGSGFSPRVPVNLTRGADQLPAATSDNSGSVRQRLLVPQVPAGLVETQVQITATDGVTTAQAFMNVARVGAEFTPTTGDPRSLRVSHVISGFGLSELKPSIYVHYVSPAAQQAASKAGRAATSKVAPTTPAGTGGAAATTDPPGVKSIRLGQLRGPCGVLRTSPRKLFPFKPINGSWLLQYDTRPLYTRGTTNSAFLWVSRKVTIAG